MLIFNKLQEARIFLRISQDEAAKTSGVNQGDISLLESGKKVFIPTEYLMFLAKKGINLNDLFNEFVTVEQFVKGSKVKGGDECLYCREKDLTISAMQNTIGAMRETIETLKLKFDVKIHSGQKERDAGCV